MDRRLLPLFLFAALALRAGAGDYYLLASDPKDHSSMSGTGSAAGWATTPGGAQVAKGATDAAGVYHVTGDLMLRTPRADAHYTFGGGRLVFDGTVPCVNLKIPGGKTLTIPDLLVASGTQVDFLTGGSGTVHVLDGTNWTIEAGGVLGLACALHADSSIACNAAISGAGTVAAVGRGANAGSVTLAGDLSGFSGVLNASWQKRATATDVSPADTTAHRLGIAAMSAVPQLTPDGDLLRGAVVVTNGATLAFACGATSPEIRGWDFGSGVPPTVEVADGCTVVVEGPVQGTAGFAKTGAGTLVLNVGGAGGYGTLTLAGATNVSAAALASYVAGCEQWIADRARPDPAPRLRAAQAVAGGASFALVSGTLGAYGENESSAMVKMRFWKTSDPAATSVVSVATLSGDGVLLVPFERTVTGFEPDAEYGYAIRAEGANGASDEFGGTFTTLSGSVGTAASGGTASVVDSADRVHVFSESGTFAATGRGWAEVLVVGGGGAGGHTCGGGGGGGGVVHAGRVFLEPGTYAVTVGAGGTMTNGTTASKVPGGDSSFALASGPAGFSFDAITAYGGGCGVGWGDNSVTGSSGASGGGGARNRKGTEATCVPGQGHLGGNPVDLVYKPGGGGGAGGPGADGTAAGVPVPGPGAGGPGRAFSITGTRVVYGSGGGGGARVSGDARAPGGENGGSGASWTEPAEPGVDGTGGGGGGGSDAAAYKPGGVGGHGVVVVRYTDVSLAGGAPALSVHRDSAEVGCNAIRLPVDVADAGTGADTVALTVTWRYAGEASDLGSRTLAGFVGATAFDIPADPGRAYSVSVAADNGLPGGTAEWTGVFDSAPMFPEAPVCEAAGGVLRYVVAGTAAEASQRLELWVGPDAATLTNQATWTEASYLSAGAHAVAPFSADQIGDTVAILLRHVAVAEGGRAFTNDAPVLGVTLKDAVTYLWKAEVSDGDWCNPDNWTADGGLGGWPSVGSTARFPACTATVRVDRAVSFSTAKFISGGTWSFAGTTSGASLSFAGSGDAALADGAYVFDALALRVTAGQNGWLGGNQKIVLVNGASLVSTKNLCLRAAGGSLLVGAGCSFAGTGLGGSNGASLVVSNGTATVSGAVNLSERGSAESPPATLAIHGADARVSCNGFFSQYTNATVTIRLDGVYSPTEALVAATGTTKMAASGGVLTFEAPSSRAADAIPACDVFVADWTKSSIDVSRIAFGEVDRKESYFYFTEEPVPGPARKALRWTSPEAVLAAGGTAKCLWYHHAGFPATIMILR